MVTVEGKKKYLVTSFNVMLNNFYIRNNISDDKVNFAAFLHDHCFH